MEMQVKYVKNVRELLSECTCSIRKFCSQVKLPFAGEKRTAEPARRAWTEKQRNDAGALAASRQIYWLK